MALDDILGQDLKNYITAMTSIEPPLFEQLRQETQTTVGQGQMLSGPVEGKLLQMLVKLSGANTCLEVGTFTGYSALNIASALPEKGKLITCEVNEDCAKIARKYFDRTNFSHKIEIRLGDATQTVQEVEPYFDFIFIDADKANYPFYYDTLLPKLRQGGLMVVDNALWSGRVLEPLDKSSSAIHELNVKAHHDNRVETVMLSVRDGILLIRKI